LKPQLGQQNLVLAQRMGPSPPSFDELDSPVLANGLKLRASAATGSHETDGHDLSLAGLHDRVSYSAGHYRFSTDGFRENNDFEQEVANAFVQYRPTSDTNLLAELRSARIEQGDLSAFFNRDVYAPSSRFNEDADSVRFGGMQRLKPNHTLLASLIYQDVQAGLTTPNLYAARFDLRDYGVDVQHVYAARNLRIQSGALAGRENLAIDLSASPPGLPAVTTSQTLSGRKLVLYSYSYFDVLPSLTLTAGVSLDHVDSAFSDEEAANPKLGISWRPTARTAVRASAFETLFGSLSTSKQNVQPRLEPVQVAGFTQTLSAGPTDRSSVRGVAVDQELSPKLFVGWQADTRDTQRLAALLGTNVTIPFELRERSQRAYLYWLPTAKISVTARYEHGRNDSEPLAPDGYSHMKTERLPVEIRYFANGGLTIGARGSTVHQEGDFQSALAQSLFVPLAYGEDEFFVLDAFVGYRLPNRRGLLSLTVDNALDESFQFQDVEPTNPSLFPERLISFRFTLAFE